MARKRKKVNGRRSTLTIPVAVAAGFAVPLSKSYTRYKSEGINGAIAGMINYFTGFEPNTGGFKFSHMQYGLLPVIVGMAVHRVAGALGVNRALAQAGIPLLRI